jgi:hypothetical protein
MSFVLANEGSKVRMWLSRSCPNAAPDADISETSFRKRSRKMSTPSMLEAANKLLN